MRAVYQVPLPTRRVAYSQDDSDENGYPKAEFFAQRMMIVHLIYHNDQPSSEEAGFVAVSQFAKIIFKIDLS